MSSTMQKTTDPAKIGETVETVKNVPQKYTKAIADYRKHEDRFYRAAYDASETLGPWIASDAWRDSSPYFETATGKRKRMELAVFSDEVLGVKDSTLRQWMKLYTLNQSITEPVQIAAVSDVLWKKTGVLSMTWKAPKVEESLPIVLERLAWMRANTTEDSIENAELAVLACSNDLEDLEAVEAFKEAEKPSPEPEEATATDPADQALKAATNVLRYLGKCEFEQAESLADRIISDIRAKVLDMKFAGSLDT